MTFKNLEDTLPNNQILHYLELFDELQEPTKTVLGYTLDISSYLNSLGLQKEYGIFGGYAVLSHLMGEYGPQIAKLWRGSSDIDMAGTGRVLSSIKAGYLIHSDRTSPNIVDKRTLKLKSNKELECKIDFSTGNFIKKYGEIEKNYHFGIPLNVIGPEDLIRGKLYLPMHEEQHLGDILAMLSVLEKRGCAPKDVSSFFIGPDRKELHRRLKHSLRIFKKDRFGFFPSNDFLKEFKNDLSKKIIRNNPQITNFK